MTGVRTSVAAAPAASSDWTIYYDKVPVNELHETLADCSPVVDGTRGYLADQACRVRCKDQYDFRSGWAKHCGSTTAYCACVNG